MDELGALLTVAEIAVGIAGFAGIAIVLARRPGEWAETDAIRLLVLLTASGNAFILALLSAGLILAGLDAGTLAAASSASMLILSAISTIVLTPRILRYRRRAPAEVLSRSLYRFMLAGIIVFTLVVGRKGWLFSDTVRGAEASANLYSLIGTARENGLEPYAYLRRVFEELPRAATLAEIELLLPHRIELRPSPAVKS